MGPSVKCKCGYEAPGCVCGKFDHSSSAADYNTLVPSVSGYVTYDVRVTCPHCEKSLHLNQYPYSDDETEYSLAEDDLGKALFGYVSKPARWNEIAVEYTCCGCNNKFQLSRLEI